MEFHTGYRNWKLKITWDQLFDNQWTKAINGDEMLKISILFREHFFERYHTDWSMDSWINIKWLTIICSPRWMRGAPLLKYLQCTNLIRCPTMKPNTFRLIHSQNILDSTIWHAFRTPAIVVCLKTLCIEVIDQPRCRKYADAIYFFFFFAQQIMPKNLRVQGTAKNTLFIVYSLDLMLEHGKSIIDYGVKLLPGFLVVSPWRNVWPKIYTENYHRKKEALFIECQRKKQSHFGILQRFRAIDIAKLIEICVNASSRKKRFTRMTSIEYGGSTLFAKSQSFSQHKNKRQQKAHRNESELAIYPTLYHIYSTNSVQGPQSGFPKYETKTMAKSLEQKLSGRPEWFVASDKFQSNYIFSNCWTHFL